MLATPALRLILDGNALIANWRWLAERSAGAACGAAVKANGYGLGAHEVTGRLAGAGCRDFFVATWQEAERLGPLPEAARLSVLHGVREFDLPAALTLAAKPVLNTPDQVRRWKSAASGRQCDVMVDTGMNRLGLTPEQAVSGLLDGLNIDTLMSHLACADEPLHPMNAVQRVTFAQLKAVVPARRYSLSNSAGICGGQEYCFDLTRPGLALYGGIAHPEAQGHITPVVRPEAEVLQIRDVGARATIGYGATFTAPHDMRVAILNIGYADGYLRAFTENGAVRVGDALCPVLGRVSMDLIAVDISGVDVREGDWLEIDYHLPAAAAATGLSQYELLTGLGSRYQRVWTSN
jgi:alanine racemase